jgi:hypothetical protein
MYVYLNSSQHGEIKCKFEIYHDMKIINILFECRFFVLSGSELKYYVDDSLSNNKGTFPLNESCIIEAKPATSKRKFLFLITDVAGTEKRKMIMNAPDAPSYQNWFTSLQKVVDNLKLEKRKSSESKGSSGSRTPSVGGSETISSKQSAETKELPSVLNGSPAFVLKSKVAGEKVFVNVLVDDSIPLSAAILGDDCPHAVPYKDGNLSDTYDVCINSESRSDDFNREVRARESSVVCAFS